MSASGRSTYMIPELKAGIFDTAKRKILADNARRFYRLRLIIDDMRVLCENVFVTKDTKCTKFENSYGTLAAF
jgi:hypothetical protein